MHCSRLIPYHDHVLRTLSSRSENEQWELIFSIHVGGIETNQPILTIFCRTRSSLLKCILRIALSAQTM